MSYMTYIQDQTNAFDMDDNDTMYEENDNEMTDEVETTQAKDGVLGRWAKKLRLGLD